MLNFGRKWILGSCVFVTTIGHAASDYLQGHLGGLSNQVSSQVGNVPGNRYNGDFEIKYQRGFKSFTDIETKIHGAGLVNDQGLFMYSVQEAYVGLKFERHNVKVGREILPWSQIDHTWGFGKLNNRRNFDFFNPGQEGLIGVLYEYKDTSGFRGSLFASGLYLPELNPGLDVNKSKGTITSRNPWSDTPASRADVEGTMMDVKYDVKMPRTSDVIAHYSIGVNAGYESKHWVMDNFIMRKPENQFTPDVQIQVNFIDNIVNAQITPEFHYQDLYGSTLKYRNMDYEMYVSAIAIRPNEIPVVDEKVRYTEIKNKKRREDYVGGGISKGNDLYTVALNYVARLSPFDRTKDDLAIDPRWNQAVNVMGTTNLNRSFSVSGDAKYDMLTTDRLIMVSGNYKASQDLIVSVGVKSIGTPNDGKSYWAPYTNNDMIYGGLRYVY